MAQASQKPLEFTMQKNKSTEYRPEMTQGPNIEQTRLGATI